MGDRDIDIEAARQAVEEAAADSASRVVREAVCDALAAAFRRTGELLWLNGYMLGTDRRDGQSPFGFGSDATVGLALIAQIGGELIAGSISVLAQDNLYAAAVLLRQLVEVENLAWAFAEDEQEATAWMRATREERLRMWQPRHVRDRSAGRFRATDYQSHCECGGHPTPEAAALLPNHSRRRVPEMWRLDLAQHGVSAWQYVADAALRLGHEDWMASISESTRVADVVGRWEREDRLWTVARRALSLL